MSRHYLRKPLSYIVALSTILLPTICGTFTGVFLSSCDEDQHSAARRYMDDIEITLEVQPTLNDEGVQIPPEAQDMEEVCQVINQRLLACNIPDAEIFYKGDKIVVHISREGKNFLSREKNVDVLKQKITEIARMEVLIIHPDSERVIADPETQAAIADYEQKMADYEEAVKSGQRSLRHPKLPRIPLRFGLNDYMILPYSPGDEKTDEGQKNTEHPLVNYRVVMSEFAAIKNGVYITSMEILPNKAKVFIGTIYVEFNSTGEHRMRRMNALMSDSKHRVAVVLNGQIICDPIVHGEKDLHISGLKSLSKAEAVVSAWRYPLSHDLKVIDCREMPHLPRKTAKH